MSLRSIFEGRNELVRHIKKDGGGCFGRSGCSVKRSNLWEGKETRRKNL